MARLFLMVFLVAMGQSAHASLLLSGSFNIAFPAASQGINSLVGDFSFSFDDSAVVGTSFELFTDLPLDSFNLEGGIGGTTFTDANTGGFVFFQDSVLGAFGVGGLINGVEAIVENTNDFLILVAETMALEPEDLALVSVASFSNADTARPGSGATFELDAQFIDTSPGQVPVSSTLALLLMGLLSLGLGRRSLPFSVADW